MSDDSDLERRYQVLRTAIHTVNCGLIARDRSGTILFVNDRLLAWLGYAREEVVGRPLEHLVPAELREQARRERELTDNEGDYRARLTVLQRKDSTTFPVVALPQQIDQQDGRPAGTFAIVIDLGAVQTAKQSGHSADTDLRTRLDRIAMEIQAIGLTAALPAPSAVPLDHPDLDELSPREREVLSHLGAGERVPAIARSLHISPHTVRNHLKAIYRKVGVQTQNDLIQWLREL